MAGLFNDIKNKALNAALNIADTFTPVLKESKFRETGFITPEEFVAAGDFLTGHCPTWQWATVANPKACKDYLPRDRQFLITKNVPCSKRCRHLMDSLKDNQEKVVEEETGDGGWVDTHYSTTAAGSAANAAANQVQEMTDTRASTSKDVPLLKNIPSKSSDNEDDENNDDENNEDDDDEAIDMDDYDHNIRDDSDETTITKSATDATSTTQAAAANSNAKSENSTVHADKLG